MIYPHSVRRGWFHAGSVESYPRAAVERAIKVQELALRGIAKKIAWWQEVP